MSIVLVDVTMISQDPFQLFGGTFDGHTQNCVGVKGKTTENHVFRTFHIQTKVVTLGT